MVWQVRTCPFFCPPFQDTIFSHLLQLLTQLPSVEFFHWTKTGRQGVTQTSNSCRWEFHEGRWFLLQKVHLPVSLNNRIISALGMYMHKGLYIQAMSIPELLCLHIMCLCNWSYADIWIVVTMFMHWIPQFFGYVKCENIQGYNFWLLQV